MKRLFLVLFGAALLTSPEATAQSKPGSIQGVWQVAEVTMTGPRPMTISIPEPRPNLTIVTARHYAHVEIRAEGPRPMLEDESKADADQLRAAWGPFAGEAGTYDIDGSLVTMHPIVSKSAAAMAPGAFNTWSYKLVGDTLVMTEQRNQKGPIANPATVKAVRVE